MRNVSPQLSSLDLRLPSHRFVSIASSFSRDLKELDISCVVDNGRDTGAGTGSCSACERQPKKGAGTVTGQLHQPSAPICRCGAGQYPETVTALTLRCSKCCLRHMVMGISASGNVAAQLTNLYLIGSYRNGARASSGKIRMGKFCRLTSLTATELKVRLSAPIHRKLS